MHAPAPIPTVGRLRQRDDIQPNDPKMSNPVNAAAAARARGFTLTELLIVLTIVGLAAGLAAPPLQTLLAKNRILGRSSALMADLSYARSEAIRQATAVTVCASADAATCAGAVDWAGGRIIFTDPTGARAVTPASRLLRVHRPASSNDVLTVTPAMASVTFQADGSAAAPAVFRLCSPAGAARAVSVSGIGRARAADSGTPCP